MDLEQAIQVMTSTFQSLEQVAQGLPVDAQEVADALETVEPDTAEHVALQVLAKLHPVTPEVPDNPVE